MLFFSFLFGDVCGDGWGCLYCENGDDGGACSGISHSFALEIEFGLFYRDRVKARLARCRSFSPVRLFFDLDLFALSGLLSSDRIARSEDGDKERFPASELEYICLSLSSRDEMM